MKCFIFVSWRLFPYFGPGCCDLQRGLVAPSAKFAGDFILQNLFCPCLWCVPKLRLILDYNLLEKSCPKFPRTYEEQYEEKAQTQHYLLKLQTVSWVCCRRFLAETGSGVMETEKGWGTKEWEKSEIEIGCTRLGVRRCPGYWAWQRQKDEVWKAKTRLGEWSRKGLLWEPWVEKPGEDSSIPLVHMCFCSKTWVSQLYRRKKNPSWNEFLILGNGRAKLTGAVRANCDASVPNLKILQLSRWCSCSFTLTKKQFFNHG